MNFFNRLFSLLVLFALPFILGMHMNCLLSCVLSIYTVADSYVTIIKFH